MADGLGRTAPSPARSDVDGDVAARGSHPGDGHLGHVLQADLDAGLRACSPVVWRRPERPTAVVAPDRPSDAPAPVTFREVTAADARLRRLAPLLARTFPGPWHAGPDGTEPGVIDSPLSPLPRLGAALGVDGLWLKRDDALPVSGSIKARGGIHEVLAVAERLAGTAGLLPDDPDLVADAMTDAAARELFGRHTIAVGSTGNLGLSIGIMARALGFRATIHMSADARRWKKDRLRALGAEVVEYPGDYGLAVETGRARAADDPACHFVDDENSRDLFVGYAVAGLRLVPQLEAAGLLPTADGPLHVHLPCGVGGGPGGVAHGIRLALTASGYDTTHLHCWYAEPVAAPCMLLALATGLGDAVSVQDVGCDGRTAADGLAVSRASRLAWSQTKDLVAGAYTVTDAELLCLLRLAHETEGLALEPSALAGVAGPTTLRAAGVDLVPGARHLAWATGGSMVPPEEFARYLTS